MILTANIIAYTVALAATYLGFDNNIELIDAARGVGDQLLAWLRRKLPAEATKSLDDLQADPADPDNQADLRKRLLELLRADPDAEAELRALLPTTTTTTQTATNVQNSNVIQNTGSANITISG